MPSVHTPCPACGQTIDLVAGRCALLCDLAGQTVAYAFVCPRCDEPVVRTADRVMVAMLVAGGVAPHGRQGLAVGTTPTDA